MQLLIYFDKIFKLHTRVEELNWVLFVLQEDISYITYHEYFK